MMGNRIFDFKEKSQEGQNEMKAGFIQKIIKANFPEWKQHTSGYIPNPIIVKF